MECHVVLHSKSFGGQKSILIPFSYSFSRRGEELQEELWSKFTSGEPSIVDATFGVTEVIVYDLQQIFKKYGIHPGRYVERFPSTIEEMDYYVALEEENEKIRRGNKKRWQINDRQVVLQPPPRRRFPRY